MLNSPNPYRGSTTTTSDEPDREFEEYLYMCSTFPDMPDPEGGDLIVEYERAEMRRLMQEAWGLAPDDHMKQQHYPEVRYHRKLLFSVSGWLLPVGKTKRGGKIL